MTERMTRQRIEELLQDVKQYENNLNANQDKEPPHMVALAWTTLAIAKAKLQALKGETND
jgi:hypothetical protein